MRVIASTSTQQFWYNKQVPIVANKIKNRLNKT